MTPGMSGRVIFLLFVVIVGSCTLASAQYYEGKDYSQLDDVRYISVGVVNREFTPRSTNPFPDSLAIRFNRIMPVISFRQGAGELMFGYSTYKLAGSSKSTIFFGGRFGTEVPIAGHRPSVLLFPLQLAAEYTKAEGVGPSKENFNIASVGIGMGLKYRYFTSSLDFSIGVEELAQYSTEGIGIGSGFSASTLGDAVILLKDLGVFEGTVIGYRFRLQTWAMSESKFNYRSVSHGPYLGIMF